MNAEREAAKIAAESQEGLSREGRGGCVMTAPETTAPAPAEQETPEPSDWPLAEEALAAMPEDKRDLYAPLEVPPEPKWEPWPEYAACRAFSADEQAAEMRRWWNGLCERMYAGMRGPGGWLTGNAPDPQPIADGPGPASQEQAAEASAQGLARAGREPDFSPPPTPGPPADSAVAPLAAAPVPEPEDDAAAAAVKHAADEALRRAGVKQEDLDALAQPGDGRDVRDQTTEMTAVLPIPASEQEHQ